MSVTNHLVMLLTGDDPDEVKESPVWCLVDTGNFQGAATLCTNEFFGIGESGCIFKRKTTKRGGITCPKCLEKLKVYKSIKL